MRINFYPLRHFDSASTGGFAALGAAGPVGLGLAGAQTALGIVQAISGGARSKRLMNRRRAYQTPEEIFDILKAQQSRAAEGYAPGTLNYITGQVDRGTASAIDAATRLGADPNQLNNLLDQKIQSTFRIGAENQLQNMKNFSGYIDALGLVASNKAAEQKSQQDIIKDQLQAASQQQQSGLQNIIGGANTLLSTVSSAQTAGLYNTPADNVTAPVLGPQLPNTPVQTVPINTDITGTIGQRSSPNVGTTQIGPTQADIEAALELLNRTGILQRR